MINSFKIFHGLKNRTIESRNNLTTTRTFTKKSVRCYSTKYEVD